MTDRLARYQTGLNLITSQEGPRDNNRAVHLIQTTALSMRHFFETGVYGSQKNSSPDTLPGYWAYVRYLVADLLRPQFGYGPSQFADVAWKKKLLADFAREAAEIHNLLPPDLQHEEWLFMVKVAAHMLMEDPLLIEKRFITEKGRQGLINQSVTAGVAMAMTGIEMYETHFHTWKSRNETGE